MEEELAYEKNNKETDINHHISQDYQDKNYVGHDRQEKSAKFTDKPVNVIGKPKKAEEKGVCFSSYLKQALKLPETDIKTYSPLTLAFIGDSIFDLIIRTYVVESGNAPVNKLHHRCSKLVQAGAQAELYHTVKDLLTEEEMAVFKRGRNAKSFTSAKNAGLLEYRTATGLEALMGYLYLTDRTDRIIELIKYHLSKENTEV